MALQKIQNHPHAHVLLKYKQALWIVYLSCFLNNCLHFDQKAMESLAWELSSFLHEP